MTRGTESKSEGWQDGASDVVGASVLPVVAVPDAVLFPKMTVNGPAASSRAALPLATGSLVFVAAQRALIADPEVKDLHSVGVVARVEAAAEPGGELKLIGLARARATSYIKGPEQLVAAVEHYPEERDLCIDTPEGAALARRLCEVTEEYFALKQQVMGDTKRLRLSGVLARSVVEVDPHNLADALISKMTLPISEKQTLLETTSITSRIWRVLEHVTRRMHDLRAEATISSQIAEKISSDHRTMYLRQRLKAIRNELGEGDELAALRGSLAELPLPASVRSAVERYLCRLEYSSPEGQEGASLRTLLEWVRDIPWGRRTALGTSLSRAREILDGRCEGMHGVKERILRHMAVRELRESRKPAVDVESIGEERHNHVLLFVGPPGVGKTSIARSIADAMGRKYVRMAVGGVTDEATIRGHRRAYVGASPGLIIQGLRQAGSMDPVFLLDELDKLAQGAANSPTNALLDVLDPVQNHQFVDHYLGLPVDLSEVFFVATANSLSGLPKPLIDRMEVVEFESFSDDEKIRIAERFTVPREMRSAGLEGLGITFTLDALTCVIREYTRESGIRGMDRSIAEVLRHTALGRVAHGEMMAEITPAFVRSTLGRPLAKPVLYASTDVGAATGLHYSCDGGGVMVVEAAVEYGAAEVSRRQPTLLLTGQLGKVMQESCRIALTCTTSRFKRTPRSVHIHVPEGAVPKDGPSAGVTIAAALASAFTNRPANPDIAMTGELTLRGRIMPVGGVREKLMGAHRAGIRCVLLPRENERDLERVPKRVIDELTVQLVDDIQEVLARVLRAGSSNIDEGTVELAG